MIVILKIPQDAKLLVKEGQTANFSTPLWERVIEEKIEINISQKLAIKPKKIFDFLKKFIGDRIKKDEIIAEKKGLLFNKKILSPVDGEIREINHDLGTVIITSLTNKKVVNSFFRGEIIDIQNSNLKIKINDGRSFKIKKCQTNFGGEVYYYSSQNHLTADDVEGKIIVFNELEPFAQVKIEALGGTAFFGPIPLQTSHIPFFQLNNQKEIDLIYRLKKSTCLMLKDESKIIFYD